MKNIITLLALYLYLASTVPLHAQKHGQALIDSLKIIIPELVDQKRKAISLEHLSFAYHTINPDSGIFYAQQSLDLSKGLNWQKGIAEANNALGLNYWKKSKFDKALDYFSKAMKINEKLNSKQGLSASYGNIGIIYYQWSDYPKALEYYFKAQKVDEDLGNESGMATNFGNIGFIYLKMEDYKSAMKYFFKALSIEKRLNNKAGMAYNFGYIAEAYKYMNDIPKAMKYFGYAHEIDIKIGNISGVSSHLAGLAACHLLLGNYDESIDHYNKALLLYKNNGNKFGEAIIVGKIGVLYLKSVRDDKFAIKAGNSEIYRSGKIERLNQAREYFNKAATIHQELHDMESLSLWYEGLKDIYVELNDYKKAYEYHLKYTAVKDSVFNKEKSKEIGRLEAQRELIVKEYREKEEEKRKAEEISQRNSIQYSGMGIFVLLLFISIFVIPKVKIPFALIDALVFITFLLFYEMILVISDPYIDNWAGGIPLYKLGMNFGIALLFLPFYNIEDKIRKKFMNLKNEEFEQSLESK